MKEGISPHVHKESSFAGLKAMRLQGMPILAVMWISRV